MAGGGGGGTSPARKVMVVADPNRESAAALQYALSHVVVENDTLILLHVDNPNASAWKIPFKEIFKRPLSTNASSSASLVINTNPNAAPASTASIDGLLGGAAGGGALDFLEAMKHACGLANSKITVQTEKVESEGKDKAAVIIGQCAALGVELLVIGQKTTISNALLGARRSRSLRGLDTAEFLIENSKCTCVGVQRKAMGGYLLNSKTHKNFWLLA